MLWDGFWNDLGRIDPPGKSRREDSRHFVMICSGSTCLYEVAGNVWEWCEDWFTTELEPRIGANPRGGDSGEARVIRGGSFLCHADYCNRYRVAARSSNTPDSASSNTGFRVVALS